MKWTEIVVGTFVLVCGIMIGVGVTWSASYQSLQSRDMKIEVMEHELKNEELERKVFSDGMVGCFDRLGKEKLK